jgi:hypothetical protein
MNVFEFNQTIAREKLQLPDDTEVLILSYEGDEVRVKVNGRCVWLKRRKEHVQRKCVIDARPEYSMDKSDISLGPSAYMLLQWIRSLSSSNFSLSYAARELDMSLHTIRKSLQVLRDAGKIEKEVNQ